MNVVLSSKWIHGLERSCWLVIFPKATLKTLPEGKDYYAVDDGAERYRKLQRFAT